MLLRNVTKQTYLSYAVFQLTRHMARSGEAHLKGAKRLFRYSKGTMGLGLSLIKGGGNKSLCKADTSFGVNEGDRRSTAGCVATIMGATVHQVSLVHKTTNLSRTETEHVAMCRAAQEAVFSVIL